VVLVNYQPRAPANLQTNALNPAPASNVAASRDADDETLVSRVSQQDPNVGKVFEENLKEINTYISDAEQALNDNPEDSAAQQHLVDAYEQKAMLYEMATARALE